ncbi:MAG: ABC transporter ATP-binding protein [Myxococcota bacterium]|jgi:ABC-type lipoprotein export system ATPase subunit|nr:ABC transporter ATP-binding protein [Myxococcota bacterium]
MSSVVETPLIKLQGMSKHYGKGESLVKALDGIDLEVSKGEFLAVMGASGSGKSTCMNMLGFLDSPTAGKHYFRGVDVSTLDGDQRALLRRHFIGFVFQGFNLLARLTARENVELPLIYRRMQAAKRRELSSIALEKVGLSDRGHHLPSELSGGQQQRVAIARALVTTPSLLLADEPTGNLDSKTTVEIMDLLVSLNKDEGISIVMVTHEPEMAEYAQRIVEFRDGRIIRDTGIKGVN